MVHNRLKRYDRSAFFYILPSAVLMICFIVLPMVLTLRYSMTNWKGLVDFDNVGLKNYRTLFSDPVFWESIRLTFTWVVLTVAFIPFISMFLALIVEFLLPWRRLRTVTRTLLFMPQMVSLVAVAVLWSLMYSPNMGFFAKLLQAFGIVAPGATVNLLGSYDYAIFFAFLPVIWQGAGFGMVIFSAAMQDIPHEVTEAAIIDGCSRGQMVWRIVVPLVKPTYGMMATLNVIGGFKAFDLIYTLTNGGPGTATQVTALYIFKEAFLNNRYGYSAAASFVLTVITVVFGVVFYYLSSRIERYN